MEQSFCLHAREAVVRVALHSWHSQRAAMQDQRSCQVHAIECNSLCDGSIDLKRRNGLCPANTPNVFIVL